MKLEAGDKVRVKGLSEIIKTREGTDDFRGTGWDDDMDNYCGNVLTIAYIDTLAEEYHMVEDNGDWCWTDDMLEDEPITNIPMWPTAEDTQKVKEAADKLLEQAAEEAAKLPLYSDTQQNMGHVLDSMKDLLIYKNNKYGNSALEPMDVFTRHLSDNNSAGLNSILVRLDDKLKRIQNAEELRKNDVSDLLGYLTLLCVDQEWTDFSEFKD